MTNFSTSKELDLYWSRSKDNIAGGGLSRGSATVWDLLFQYQKKEGILGNIAELGVFHGFTSRFDGLYLEEQEHLFLIDKFMQKEVVSKNLCKISGSLPKNLHWFSLDSMSVRKRDLLKDYVDSFRWFHIDGEHSYDAVVSDLELAVQCVSREGIIVVDDFFNIGSVGITEALFWFLSYNKHLVRMFCCGFNKAYLCSPMYLKYYRDLVYYNIVDMLESTGIDVMVIQNGWSTEIDYISIAPRFNNKKAQKIGKYYEELPPFG